MKNALGIAFLSMIAAAAGAAAAVYAIKKRDELEQYDYSFDDDDEIFFGEDGCEGCAHNDDEEDDDKSFSEYSDSEAELAALDGADDDIVSSAFSSGEKSDESDF